jgi:hypothetical protein
MAATSILAIYLLSGSDYLSGFFRISNEHILKVFVKYLDFISPRDDPLVQMSKDGQCTVISSESFTRLMCCAYLDKHVHLFNHCYKDPVQLWSALQLDGPPSKLLKCLLE